MERVGGEATTPAYSMKAALERENPQRVQAGLRLCIIHYDLKVSYRQRVPQIITMHFICKVHSEGDH